MYVHRRSVSDMNTTAAANTTTTLTWTKVVAGAYVARSGDLKFMAQDMTGESSSWVVRVSELGTPVKASNAHRTLKAAKAWAEDFARSAS